MNARSGILLLASLLSIPALAKSEKSDHSPRTSLVQPVLWYRFDYGSNPGHDVSGNGHEGLQDWGYPYPTTSLLWDRCGEIGSAHFQGNNDYQELYTPDAADLDITGAMTGMAWIRPWGYHSLDGNPSCPQGTIFSKGGNSWFQIEKFNNGIVFQNEGSGNELATAWAIIGGGCWTHVAFTRDRTGHWIRFYKNGEEVFGGNSHLNNSASANGDPVMFGNYGFHNDPGACEFNGDVDDIKIFNVELTPSEIRAEYEAIGPCTPTEACAYKTPALDGWGFVALAFVLLLFGVRRGARSTSGQA